MKNRHIIWFGIASILALLMAACGANSATPEAPTATVVPEPEISGPRTGETAPDFTLSDHTGSPVHLADELQENQVVALVFYSGYE